MKGEIRKLNHKLMSESVDRNSLMLSTIETNIFSTGNESADHDRQLEVNNREEEPVIVAVSDSSQKLSEDPVLDRLLHVDGGYPTARSFAQVCGSQNKISGKISLPRESSAVRNDHPEVIKVNSDTSSNTPLDNNLVCGGRRDNHLDEESWTLVRNRRQRKNIISRDIVGTRSQVSSLKSALRATDIYVGNCAVDATPDTILKHIQHVAQIDVQKCEKLETGYDDYTSFKVTVKMNDRIKLLSPDMWPSDIICRKYFTPRRSRQ